MLLAAGQSPLDLIPLVLAIAVLPLFSAWNGRRIGRDPGAPLIPRYWETIARGGAMAALVFALWWHLDRPFAWLGLGLPVAGTNLYLLLLIGAAGFGLALIIRAQLATRRLTPERAEQLRAQMREIKILPRTTPEFLVFLIVAAMAGFWEELVFRGFLFWFLAPYLTLWGAVAFSTAIFAFGHVYQGWKGLPRAGGLGLLFAVGYVLTGSLWWLMALHALVDFVGGFVGWTVMRRTRSA